MTSSTATKRKPPAKKPAARKPAAKKTAVKKPPAKKTAVKKPAAKKIAAKKPPAQKRWRKDELVAPLFSTPPTPSRPNLLPRYEKLAGLMGLDLLAWQKYVIKLVTEQLPDGTPAFTRVLLSLPRQNGKTALLDLMMLYRLLLHRPHPQFVTFNAQNATAARRHIVNVWYPQLERAGLAEAAGIRMRQGTVVDFKLDNGGILDVLSSTKSSGHGLTAVGLAVLDEAWAMTEAVEAAVAPTQDTVPDSQMIIASTAGEPDSQFEWWHEQQDRARALCVTDEAAQSGNCYVEWGAPLDDDLDLDDPEVWRLANPAMGSLITEKKIISARASRSESNFRRSVLNQRVSSSIDRVIPLPAWKACQSRDAAPVDGIVLGIDASPERETAAIVAVDSSNRIEVIAHQNGAEWVKDMAVEIFHRHADVLGVAVLSTAALAGTIEPLRRAGVEVWNLTSTHSAIASALFYDKALSEELLVRSDVALDDAMAAAVRRPVGKAWAWGRTDRVKQDVSPLIAASLALYMASEESERPAEKVEMFDPMDDSQFSEDELAEIAAEVAAIRGDA